MVVAIHAATTNVWWPSLSLLPSIQKNIPECVYNSAKNKREKK